MIGLLELTPITFSEAAEFVNRLHRHHVAPVGHKYSIAVSDSDSIRGVVMVGRPVARRLDDGWTLEVNRCCTDGAKNACSMLYGAAWRVAKSLGYKKLITYTLPSEGGASLRASGWRMVGEAGGGNWNVRSRPRVDSPNPQMKIKWEAS